MDAYMNWLGEGFMEFCGHDSGYPLTTDQSQYFCPRDGPGFYSDLLDFQADAYLDSGESDQENFYLDTQTVPSPLEEEFSQQVLLQNQPPTQQRKAANMRERKRMKSINDAFERLRDRIPAMTATVSDRRRLSKVDTLRLAIRYISYLTKMIKNSGDVGGKIRSKKSKKIILRCRSLGSDTGDYGSGPGQSLIGHSLSCSFPDDGIVTRSDGPTTFSAKVWIPKVETRVEL